ncbi:MAG: hypothetical protein HYZ93_02580 [Candidatus Omnitrophica bacterium]|nr:hypothetical protein [Candidatus Omnitrophota bacterium]
MSANTFNCHGSSGRNFKDFFTIFTDLTSVSGSEGGFRYAIQAGAT